MESSSPNKKYVLDFSTLYCNVFMLVFPIGNGTVGLFLNLFSTCFLDFQVRQMQSFLLKKVNNSSCIMLELFLS